MREEREDWFWQNKGKDMTADIGMQEFLYGIGKLDLYRKTVGLEKIKFLSTLKTYSLMLLKD